jgi:hypothetical protein
LIGIVFESIADDTERRSMTYQPPVNDIVFALKTAAGIDELMARWLNTSIEAATIVAIDEKDPQLADEH